MRFSSLIIGAILAGHAAAKGSPVIIGEGVKVNLSSSDSEVQPIINGGGMTKLVISYDGASYISVHYTQFDFPPGCEMTVAGSDPRQDYVMTGKGKLQLGAFWSRQINGDTMVLTTFCDELSKMRNAVYKIDEQVHGFPEAPKGFGAMSICGTDDKSNAVCFKDSHATIYGKARAVGRLVFRGTGLCTAWLVSGSNLVFTNEHCIGDDVTAKNSNIEFMREEPNCGKNGDPQGGEVFDISGSLKINASWDFALIQIDTSDGRDAAAKYGYLEIENRKPPVGEELYIPQHPGGRPKELGFEDSNESDGKCKIKGYGRGCSPEDMKYSCDTEGGSSGSPVLSRDTNKVVALHHCGGGCNGNLGAPIYKFYSMVEEFLGSSAPTLSVKPTAAPQTKTPTATPSHQPSTPSSSFGPTPSYYRTGEPTEGGDSNTKSPTKSPSASPSAAPTPGEEACEGLGKNQCKKLKESCVFGKSKIFGKCGPKKGKWEHDCSQYQTATDCSGDESEGLCKMTNGVCTHICGEDLAKKTCNKVRNTLDNKKNCKVPKKKNPCKGCHSVSEC